MLNGLTRDELNERAAEMGISAAGNLPNKAAVIEAIEDAESAGPLTVVEAIERDLARLAERDPSLARSGRAASALVLARELDGGNSATSKSQCAKALNETMDRLAELAPPGSEEDGVDAIRQQRAERRAGKAAAKG